MIQEIIVILIGLIIVAILLYKIYSFIFTKKDKEGCGCSSCHCGINKKFR